MFQLSFMIGPRPSQFRSQTEFQEAIRHGMGIGYTGVEFNLGLPLGFEPGELADFVARVGCRIPNVMTGINGIDDNLYMSVADSSVRRAAVQRIKDLIPVARRLQASMVIGTMQGRLIHEPDVKAGYARVLACLKEIAETAERHSQLIVLEPMNHMDCAYGHTLGEVMETIRLIGSTCFKPMLDTLHMNIEEKDLVQTFRRAGTELAHVHLCETNARSAGEGHLDYPKIFGVLKEINYSRWVTVKAYRDPEPMGIQKSMQFLKSLGLV